MATGTGGAGRRGWQGHFPGSAGRGEAAGAQAVAPQPEDTRGGQGLVGLCHRTSPGSPGSPAEPSARWVTAAEPLTPPAW